MELRYLMRTRGISAIKTELEKAPQLAYSPIYLKRKKLKYQKVVVVQRKMITGTAIYAKSTPLKRTNIASSAKNAHQR